MNPDPDRPPGIAVPGTPAYERILEKMAQRSVEFAKTNVLLWRQGTVVALSTSDPTVSVQLGGDTSQQIDAVHFLRDYRPQLNDSVSIMQNGSDLLIIGTTSNPAPRVLSAQVTTTETRTSTTYGDLATTGPTITNMLLYAGDQVAIEVNANIACDPPGGFAALISPQVSGAGSLSALDTNAAKSQQGVSGGGASGASQVSRITVWEIPTTGLYTFTCKYRVINATTGYFSLRRINVQIQS